MSKYKNSMNQYLLAGLFYETTPQDKGTVIYTLKPDDHLSYPSLQRFYLLEADPTEYRFALRFMDSWAHWERLCECSWFKPYLLRWRGELELKLRSEALQRIILKAKAGGKDSFTANRYILDGPWKPSTTKKGRPNKEEIRDTAYAEIAEDARRLLEPMN